MRGEEDLSDLKSLLTWYKPAPHHTLHVSPRSVKKPNPTRNVTKHPQFGNHEKLVSGLSIYPLASLPSGGKEEAAGRPARAARVGSWGRFVLQVDHLDTPAPPDPADALWAVCIKP